jgi:gamma-glutamylcysteine synthetase
MLWGIEREALRLEGKALTEAPLNLRLLPPFQGKIVPDFSDSQVELVTTPHSSWEEALENLQELHLQFYLNHPQDSLWPHSLPPKDLLEGWVDPGLSPEVFSTADRHKEESEYREHLRKNYPLKTLLTSGIHLNIGVPKEALFPLARRLWSEMGLWAFLFGNSPSPEAQLSTRLSARGYRNTLCCTGYPLLQNMERYQEDLENLLKHWSCFRLKRASELYAPIRIKKSCPQSAGAAGIPPGSPYLEIRLIDLQGGPWGLEAHHLMMSEFLLEFSLFRGDLPGWNERIQKNFLGYLDRIAESGDLADAGLDLDSWLKEGEKFIATQVYHPRFASLLQGWEGIKTRLRSAKTRVPQSKAQGAQAL